MTLILPLATVAVLAVTIFAAASDIRSLRIPNWQPLAALALFIPAYLAAPETFGGWQAHGAALGIMFVVTYIMFACGIMGGGDSKFAAALALWTGIKGLAPMLFYMALIGGLLGAATLLMRKKRPFKKPVPGSWIAAAQAGENAVPYGVAISFGFWMALYHMGVFIAVAEEIRALY